MSKEKLKENIFVEKSEEIKNIEKDLNPSQKVQFKCWRCEKISERPLYSLQQKNYELLCANCARGLHSKQTKIEKYGSVSYQNLEKRKQTLKQKYGENYNQVLYQKSVEGLKKKYDIENPSSLKFVKEKKKQKCLAKYGVDNNFKAEEIKEKSRQTCLEKYGTEYASQCEEIKEKQAITNLERWGFKSTAQNPEIKEKAKNTCLQKYGENYQSLQKEKRSNTNLKKYKTKYIFNSVYFKEKRKQTNLEKYNCEWSQQNPEIRQRQICTQKETLSKRTKEEWEEIKKKSLVSRRKTLEKRTLEKDLEIRRKSSKHYVYENMNFASSWELALWIYAKDHNEFIEKEPVVLNYTVNDVVHHYIPDFKYKNQLVEIKGDHFFDKEGNMILPFDHTKDYLMEAKHQCGLKNHVQFWTSKDIKPILDYICQKYGKDYLKQFKNLDT